MAQLGDFAPHNQTVEVGGWRREKLLGQGGFGTVTLWRCKESNNTMAVKQCRLGQEMTEKHRQRWTLEVDIMQRLSHPNVVQACPVPEAFDILMCSNKLPLMGMEFCSGGDLRKVLNRPENCCGLPEYKVRAITHDLATGIEYLHSCRIIHRDMKPENVVLQQEEDKTVYKIIDLGYAKDLDQGSVCTSFVGTLQYLAQELFQREKYTCTVDYWSFGILVFECIAGIRPFLPSLSPVQWHQEVSKKTPEDIYIFFNDVGEVQYSSKLPPLNQLCKVSQRFFEQWLQHMLHWNPKLRGGGLSERKRPKCFELLDTILNTKLVLIVCMATNQLLSFPVKDDNTLAHIQRALETQCKIPVDDQELLLASGISPDPSKAASQYADTSHGSDEWLIFLFKKHCTSYPVHQRKIRAQPPAVVSMCHEPEALMLDKDQRRLWREAIFFVSAVARDYRRLVQGKRAAMMSLLRINSSCSKLKNKLTSDMTRLLAHIDFFQKSISVDLAKYEEQTSTGISSRKLSDTWVKMRDESKGFEELKTKVADVDTQCTGMYTKVIELQRSPSAKFKQQESLDEREKEATKLYGELRNRKNSNHATDNKAMIHIIQKTLLNWEELTGALYQHLAKINSCKWELEQIIPNIERLLTAVNVAGERLLAMQLRRQYDMWHLVKVSVERGNSFQHQKSVNCTDGSGPSSTAGISMASMSSQVIFERSAEESMNLRHESMASRHRLEQMLTSLQPVSETSLSPASQGWDFLNDAVIARGTTS